MKTAFVITPATDGQYDELKIMFEHTARGTVSDKDAVQRLLGLWDKIGPEIAPILRRYSLDLTLVDSDLLGPVTMATLPGCSVTPSVLKDGINQIGNVEIKLWLGSNAAKLLRQYPGTINAEPLENARIHQMKKGSTDGPILGALGGVEVCRMSFGNFMGQILAQNKGETGLFLTNGYATIVYLEEFPGWAFGCRWRSNDGEWNVGADPVADPFEGGCWPPGCLPLILITLILCTVYIGISVTLTL